MSLLQDLKSNILVADGAMGTLLYSYGVGVCFEELNINEKDLIRQIHLAYLQAGAQVIQTNTYGANYEKLSRYGLEERVKEFNTAAIMIAREAIQAFQDEQRNPGYLKRSKLDVSHKNGLNTPYLLGSIGGIRGLSSKNISLEEIKRSFREQLYCLLLEGVDGILLETYYDLDELQTVLAIARKETSLPIIAQVSLHDVGVLQGGVLLSDALAQLTELGADIVGLNCRLGPHHMIRSLEKVPIPDKGFLSAYPNASLPDYVDGKLVYSSEPAYFKGQALALREQGVRLMGGCCGTLPEHIRAMSEAVSDLPPVQDKIVRKQSPIQLSEEDNVQHKQEEPIHHLVQQRSAIIVELDPPKKLNMQRFIAGAKALKEAGVDALTMADNSLASPRISNMAAGTIVKNEIGLRPLVHVTCRDRNLIGLQSHLMGLHTLGINQVLAVTGDPTKVGDFPGATSVYDLSSIELIRFIKQFNEGISFSGQSLGTKTSFSVAAAFNPNVRHLDKAVERMEKKIEAGADYFITQPIYQEEQIYELYQKTKHIQCPIFIGVMPLTSYRNAEFLHNEVPGIRLTDQVRQRMAKVAHDPQQSQKEGITIAKELVDTAYQYFKGIYLITPFLKYEMTVEISEYIQDILAYSKRSVEA